MGAGGTWAAAVGSGEQEARRVSREEFVHVGTQHGALSVLPASGK